MPSVWAEFDVTGVVFAKVGVIVTYNTTHIPQQRPPMIRTLRTPQIALAFALGLVALALLTGKPPRAGAVAAGPGHDAVQMPYFSFSRRAGAGVP